MSLFQSSISVLVAGAGPTGLTVANLLGRMGISVLVLEKNEDVVTMPRAIVLDDEGARAVQAAGLIEALIPSLLEGEGPLFFDDNGSLLAQMGPGSKEYGFSKRYFMNQPALERVLKTGLGRFPCVQLAFGAELLEARGEAQDVTVHFRHDGTVHVIRAAILLACDGARSPIRQMLGISMQGASYDEEWLVIDTKNDPDQSRNSKAHCCVSRPYMSIPAPQGGRRYEFKMLPGESAEHMRTFPSIQRILSPLRDVRPQDVVRVAVYHFEAKIAERLAAGRILLLGDAAHLTPPFAGQGMNAGLRDAMNIAWKIAMVVRQEARPELLLSYETERRDPIWAMIQLAVTMGDFIMPRSEADRHLRAGLLDKLSAHSGAIEYLVGMKFKPKARYTAGAFLGLQPCNVPASLVGSMIPQPRVRSAGKTVLLDELIGANFSILAQSRELADFAREQCGHLWPELKPAIISLQESNPHAPCIGSDNVIEEPDVAFPLRAHRDQLLVVRPDRFAALAFWPSQMREVVDEFRTVLHSTVPP